MCLSFFTQSNFFYPLSSWKWKEPATRSVRPSWARASLGKVYVAFDTVEQRTLAVEVSKSHSNQDGISNTIIREIYALERVAHPNVIELVGVYGVGERLLFELGDEDLSHAIRDGRALDANHITLHLCRAMEHCHSMGVMHRDLKPANVVLRNDVAKVADFGMMRCIYGAERTYTRAAGTHALGYLRRSAEQRAIRRQGRHLGYRLHPCAQVWPKRPLFPGECEVGMLFLIFRRARALRATTLPLTPTTKAT